MYYYELSIGHNCASCNSRLVLKKDENGTTTEYNQEHDQEYIEEFVESLGGLKFGGSMMKGPKVEYDETWELVKEPHIPEIKDSSRVVVIKKEDTKIKIKYSFYV